jgi:hypothetical protein
MPRRLLEEHLRNIITRHKHLIPRVDEFISALFLKPDPAASPLLQKRAKEKAIFHFNRKTQSEAKAIWLRKTKECTLAKRLGLPPGKAGDAKDQDIRRWRILEFAATRRVEIITTLGKGATKTERVSTVRLPASTIEKLVETVANKATKWADIKNLVSGGIAEAFPGARPVQATRSPFNKDYFSQLQDLAYPPLRMPGKKQMSRLPQPRIFSKWQLRREQTTPHKESTRGLTPWISITFAAWEHRLGRYIHRFVFC